MESERTDARPSDAPPGLRVGIAGAGNIFRNHLEAYHALPGVEVVGVCDVDLDRARRVASQYGVPRAFGSVQELLAWRDSDDHAAAGAGLDILSVCTPHPTHEEVVTLAAQAGVHVLCEKPIAIDLDSAARMDEQCRAAGVKLGVLFQRRFWPAAQRLRAAIDDGTLGSPILAQCSVMLHREPEYYSSQPWRGSWATDGGGVLLTQAIHYLDLLQWYMGRPVEVFGRTATFVHGENMETEDSAVATITFANGSLATVQASTAVTPALGAQVRVTGSTGATAQLTEFPEGTDGRLDLWASGETVESNPTWPAETVANADLSTINGALIPWHRAQVAQFVAAVREDGEPAITGEDAVSTLRMVLAVYESARTGRPVAL